MAKQASKGKRSSPSKKGYWAAYKFIAVSQRVKRLERHIKRHPNDIQALRVLADGPKIRRGRGRNETI